jgi:DNA-binding response OmpR family regulator
MLVLVVEDQAELADDIADGLRDQGIGGRGLRRLGRHREGAADRLRRRGPGP